MWLQRRVDRRSGFPWWAAGPSLLTLTLVLGAGPFRSSAADSGALDPAVGQLLVARAGLPDPNFNASVVLLLDYDEAAGAVGVVLNRRSGLAVGEALPSAVGLSDREDYLYLGGPVALDTLIVLIAAAEAPPSATPILPGLAVVRGGTGLEELVAGDPPAPSVRFYAGYAGWAAGQLEGEIERGVWNLLPGHSRWVFDERPERVWDRLVDILFGPKA